MVWRCNISMQPRENKGKSHRMFLCLLLILLKNRVSTFMMYMRERIYQIKNILFLGIIIREKSSYNFYGWSWMS